MHLFVQLIVIFRMHITKPVNTKNVLKMQSLKGMSVQKQKQVTALQRIYSQSPSSVFQFYVFKLCVSRFSLMSAQSCTKTKPNIQTVLSLCSSHFLSMLHRPMRDRKPQFLQTDSTFIMHSQDRHFHAVLPLSWGKCMSGNKWGGFTKTHAHHPQRLATHVTLRVA